MVCQTVGTLALEQLQISPKALDVTPLCPGLGSKRSRVGQTRVLRLFHGCVVVPRPLLLSVLSHWRRGLPDLVHWPVEQFHHSLSTGRSQGWHQGEPHPPTLLRLLIASQLELATHWSTLPRFPLPGLPSRWPPPCSLNICEIDFYTLPRTVTRWYWPFSVRRISTLATMLLQMTRFQIFHGRIIFHCVCRPEFLYPSSVDRHLGNFHHLATLVLDVHGRKYAPSK